MKSNTTLRFNLTKYYNNRGVEIENEITMAHGNIGVT